MLLKCESCGELLTGEVHFCPKCGLEAPPPPEQPYATLDDLAELNDRLSRLEKAVEVHAEESRQAWSRLPALEDSDRRSRRILNSSTLYTEMFGWRLLTMVGYGLLSGLLVAGLLLGFALATGLLHR